jgi:hypothetical protein
VKCTVGMGVSRPGTEQNGGIIAKVCSWTGSYR